MCELSWIEVFWIGIVRVEVILGRNFPGGNRPYGIYPGWEFGESLGVGNCRVGIIWIAIFRVKFFILPTNNAIRKNAKLT